MTSWKPPLIDIGHDFPTIFHNYHLVTIWWFQPSEKYQNQLGGLATQYMEKCQNIPNHQPVKSGSQNMEFITINHHESPLTDPTSESRRWAIPTAMAVQVAVNPRKVRPGGGVASDSEKGRFER